MKVTIIGIGSVRDQVRVDEIIKRVENETGEKVEIVDITKPEPLIIKPMPPMPIIETIDYTDKPKTKGHERPYKYHR